MKIISYNVNGIRSALNKGLLEWLRTENPDVLCLQELKAMEEQVDWTALKEMGYHIYLNPAQKKGYSGVGILSKMPADRVVCGMGIEQHDAEGRVIRADFAGLTVVSVYFPSGTSGAERQDVKVHFFSGFSAMGLHIGTRAGSGADCGRCEHLPPRNGHSQPGFEQEQHGVFARGTGLGRCLFECGLGG